MTTEQTNAEIEVADFQHQMRREEARERVCEAAVKWWRCLCDDDIEGAWDAEDDLEDAAKRLAELEAADVPRRMVCDLMDEWKAEAQ